MSLETLLVREFKKGGRRENRKRVAQRRDYKNIHSKRRAALTASSVCAGGGPAEASRVIYQQKIIKPVRHPAEEPKKSMQSSACLTVSSPVGSLV